MPRQLNHDFERLVFERRAFLEPHLTVTEVARRLQTNKTYISKLVNELYGMSFPDLVNALRVRHAQEYRAAHPGARQQEVAAACGFSSVSFFNRVFKKVSGAPPGLPHSRSGLPGSHSELPGSHSGLDPESI